MQPTTFLLLTTLVASVSAHGWIDSVKVASTNKVFKGNMPTEETPKGAASAIRQIANNIPVKDLSSDELTCGRDALKASQVATVPAGAKLEITWKTATGDGLWFHDVGPMMTYMASCGGDCTTFDASKAKWFKIQEQGKDDSGKWYQARLDDGEAASVTIPSSLKAGNYLLRHEIVALHTAMTEGNAEFYPGCVQLSVTGSGSSTPSSDELVSLPGAYKSTDPGILIDVYNMAGSYKFPGPAVASLVIGSPSSGGDADDDTEDASSDDDASSNNAGSNKGDDTDSETTTKKSASSTKAASTSTKAASPTTTADSSAPTTSSSSSPSCKAKRERRRAAKRAAKRELAARKAAAQPVDVREEVRRSRMRNLHRAAAGARSF
ncbi:hypothetical protein MKEN_00970900 [Mycena kentingensis (nom. inval.)]|nr:hypothetical protein MKEN_00970900 [Mycena kentingensis (nom. inval.)]